MKSIKLKSYHKGLHTINKVIVPLIFKINKNYWFFMAINVKINS